MESQRRGAGMSELKPCPFCGKLPRTEMYVTQKGGGEDHVDFSIHCTKCGCVKTVRLKIVAYCNFIDVDKAEAEVIEAWNKRAGD